MNDPGLDDPISQDAQKVEKQKVDEQKEEEEHEQAFLDPSRWWFASTAFPLIAGTFGPMASAFSICALVVHWRVILPQPGGELIYVDDPKWLIGINAAQLAIAIASNLSLLLNMAQRLRFSIAQPITIIGCYISSFVLVILTACAAGPLKLQDPGQHAFSQAFYYATFSAVLYFIVASLMVVTVWGAHRGHYEKEFKLTMSQRTLMLQTISFLVYLLAGAAVFSHVEGWSFLDAVYWADFTLLTVGIGDLAPSSHLGRGLLFPFAIGGIIILGLVIGSIRSLVLDRGKEKMSSRMVEKERRRLLKKLQNKGHTEVLTPVSEKGSVSRTSTKDFTERQRRKQEFELMRKIQQAASAKRKWTSLMISGGTWLVLWFVGAAIFETCEKEHQGWSYFMSLYFAYTSLLTIGYGDFYPLSFSGKPFFVFWTLLAVPSLTILISNMGDTIVKLIRDLTIYIGNFTVLPGEQGARAAFRESANKLSRGRIFASTSEEPPGLLGESKARKKVEEDPNPAARKNDPESAAQRVESDVASEEEEGAAKKADVNNPLPQSRRHYHFLLIREISRVMKHINSSPPRKYMFDEWAWYLKLIGEDESHPGTHRKPLRKPKRDGEALGTALENKEDGDREAGEPKKWSWIGHRSPLMGNKEESEWVLERLTEKLQRELEEVKREEEMEREGSGRRSGASEES